MLKFEVEVLDLRRTCPDDLVAKTGVDDKWLIGLKSRQ